MKRVVSQGRRAIRVAVLMWPMGFLGPSASQAQPIDTLLSKTAVIARFDDARALAVDGAGKLYVVDRGNSSVVQLAADGTVLANLGGPGSEDSQFDEPADIDPADGLVWVVADAGNSRLQRFSHTHLHMETLPVARIEHFTPGVSGRLDPGANEGPEGDGRPIAVGVSPSNELFAIDEAQGLVLKWDASRRLERTIGGYDAGAGALSEPTALAVDASSLFVADQGRGAVFIYDLFGSLVRTLTAENIQALALHNGDLWITRPDRILVYERGERLVRVMGFEVGEAVVDAVPHGESLYLLTPTRLLRVQHE